MSSPVGPEDRDPRRVRNEEAGANQDARVHDARQDADRREDTRTTETRVIPAGAGTTAPTRAQDVIRTGPVTAVRHEEPVGQDQPAYETVPEVPTRESVVAREKEQFGGIKVGSAFFGWLAATGMAVLLTALVAAAGTAVGLATNTDVNAAVTSGNETVGLVSIIVLLVILFVSYYCGGYVAGRMARFNGTKQGFMVWVWALIVAVIVAILGVVAGQKYNVLAQLNSFPRIPVNEGELTTTSVIAAVVVAAVALVGAVLGGTAGMHFHRKVDRAGFTPVDSAGDR